MESGQDKHNIILSEFNPYITKLGITTNLGGLLIVLIPCFVLVIIGARPSWTAILSAVLMQVAASGAFFIVEPISYFPSLGIAGTYMAFLSGNIGNLRLPCSLVAQESAGVKPGTDEGSIISTIGIAVSVVVNATILTLAILFGTALLAALPASITKAFDYLLPALFASMAATSIINNPRIACIGMPLGGIMTLLYKQGVLGFVPTGVQIGIVLFVSVFGTIGICLLLDSKKLLLKTKEQ